MTGLTAAVLESRAIIEASGPDARGLLQGLVTADVEGLEPDGARSAALLTPQGKILFEFILVRAGTERFLLDTPRTLAAELAKRLMFYRLRAKVEIAERTELEVVAWWGDGKPRFAGAFADPRLAPLGWRAIVPADSVAAAVEGSQMADEAAWHAHRIGLGVPELGPDYASGEVFPHEADLDQLGGVDFAKGCFIGQEVVSRMQHRGTARSRFVPVRIAGPAPMAGAPVEADGRKIGTMGSSAGGIGLAQLRLDRVGEALAAGTPIRAGEATLTPQRPEWARFDWPVTPARTGTDGT